MSLADIFIIMKSLKLNIYRHNEVVKKYKIEIKSFTWAGKF